MKIRYRQSLCWINLIFLKNSIAANCSKYLGILSNFHMFRSDHKPIACPQRVVTTDIAKLPRTHLLALRSYSGLGVVKNSTFGKALAFTNANSM